MGGGGEVGEGGGGGPRNARGQEPQRIYSGTIFGQFPVRGLGRFCQKKPSSLPRYGIHLVRLFRCHGVGFLVRDDVDVQWAGGQALTQNPKPPDSKPKTRLPVHLYPKP